MQKIKRFITLFLLAVFVVGLVPVRADTGDANSANNMTEVAKYALQWDGKTNMKYVFGGPGGRGGSMTLEECEKNGDGFDCSAFTSMVYRHFGIEIPAQSSAQKSAAKKVFTSESDAVPGDICWWSGHVAIYIGNGKIVHTNTHRPPTNYPHVSTFAGDGANYRTPQAYLRMVDDVSQLKPIGNTTTGEETVEEVEEIKGYGTIVTESDLTGMPIKSTLIDAQRQLEMIGRDNLSATELANLQYIEEALNSYKKTPMQWYNIIQSFLGIVCILYGVLLFLCYLFDYTNVFIELPLLTIITFGRFRIIDDDDILSGAKKGWNKERGVTYVTMPMVVARSVVLWILGAVLISGKIGDLLYQLYLAVCKLI